MDCPYCKRPIEYSKPGLNWVVKCECVTVEDPLMERATQLHLRKAYETNKRNASATTPKE